MTRCSCCARLSSGWCTASPSAMICCTVIRGFSEELGSWNTTWMRWRSGNNWRRDSWCSGWPSNQTSPREAISRSSASPVVLLPDPDSPTSPRLSPRRRLKLRPESTCFSPLCRRNSPRRSGKLTSRLSTRRMTGASAGSGSAFPSGSAASNCWL